MHTTFTLPLLPLLSLLLFSNSISSQTTSQQQICSNACAIAGACYNQCTSLSSGYSLNNYAGANAQLACESQGGCLCNAEICLSCCEAAGNNAPFCSTLNQAAAGDVISYVGIVSRLLSFFPAYDSATQTSKTPVAKNAVVLLACCFFTNLIGLSSGSSSFFFFF